MVIVRIQKIPMNPWGSKRKGGFVALLRIPITYYLLHTDRRGGGRRDLPNMKCLFREESIQYRFTN